MKLPRPERPFLAAERFGKIAGPVCFSLAGQVYTNRKPARYVAGGLGPQCSDAEPSTDKVSLDHFLNEPPPPLLGSYAVFLKEPWP